MYWLARTDVRGKNAVLTLVLLPLVLPPIVSGMLLLEVVGPNGLGAFTSLSFTRSLFGVVSRRRSSPRRSCGDDQGRLRERRPALRTRVAVAWQVTEDNVPADHPAAGHPWYRRGPDADVRTGDRRAWRDADDGVLPRTLPVQIWRSFLNDGLAAAFPVAVVLVGLALERTAGHQRVRPQPLEALMLNSPTFGRATMRSNSVP